jgi:transcription factor S
MIFCPKCGSLLRPKTEKGKKMLACHCGYSSKNTGDAEIKETISKKSKAVEVVSEKQQGEHLPLTDAECSKCGNKKAFFWTVQTRAGDEPETKFLKCEKCGHTWRDYS